MKNKNWALLAISLILFGCDDGTREPSPFSEPGETGSGVPDACEALKEPCNIGAECPCWLGEPGTAPREGTRFCDIEQKWSECLEVNAG